MSKPRPNSLNPDDEPDGAQRWKSRAEVSYFFCPCGKCRHQFGMRSSEVTPERYKLELWFVDRETDKPRFQLVTGWPDPKEWKPAKPDDWIEVGKRWPWFWRRPR